MEISKEFKKEDILTYQTELNDDVTRRLSTSKRELRRIEDIVHIKHIAPNAKKVLCIGARDNSEVLSFTRAGYEVAAIDVCTQTTMITRKDVAELNLRTSGPYDVIYCSHVLEHVSDPIKSLKAIKSVARDIIFIILPIVDRKPDIEHPTVYEIMKHQPETNFNKYIQAFEDFQILQPFNVRYNCYRNGLTEEYEVAFMLQLR